MRFCKTAHEHLWIAVVLFQNEKYHHFDKELAYTSGTPRELPLTEYFLAFGLFSANPRDACVGKSQQISSFSNSQSPFLHILMLTLNFCRSSRPCLHA